jgi:glycosyltransferase involved in cell wall biosynthesis
MHHALVLLADHIDAPILERQPRSRTIRSCRPMAAVDRSSRVVGVAITDVSDWREPLSAGKWSQFFGALSRRVPVVDVLRPQLSARQNFVNTARSFRPHRARWLARTGFNSRQLAHVNAVLEHELLGLAGTYDVIVQLQTLCSPRSEAVTVPYHIYTDNTMALTQRVYRPFAPLPDRMLREWLTFEADVCRRAETVFTFSEFARRSVIDDYGCASDRVIAVGAGANQLVDSLHDKDYTRPRALFVGRPFRPKGGIVLLEAWRLVRQSIEDAELVIVGPTRDPAPGFGSGVKWLGRLGRGELARQYSSASVFVLPTMFDAWGHVFIEAMGHGLPCIGTECCAMPEIVERGVSGLLVPRGEPEPLARALVELLSDPDKAARMGRAGHTRVIEQLTWSRVVERVIGHLTAVPPGHPRA